METTRKIEQYLDGTLGEAERLILEAQAGYDTDLRNLIDLHKEVNESIADKDFFEFKSLIDKVSKEQFDSKGYRILHPVLNNLKRARKNFIKIAAALLLIFGICIAMKFVFFNSNSNEMLFKKYYVTYNADIISRTLQSDELILDRAIINYSQEEYGQAILMLNNIIQHDNTNYLAWFYRGLACLETNSVSEAIKSFRSIPENWNTPFREHRDWYLALALLHNGNTPDAVQLFKQIGIDEGYYSDKAKKIIRKIKL